MGEIIEFFISNPWKKNRLLAWLFLILLFLVGAYLFSRFMVVPANAINFHDWTDITLPRLAFLKDAVSTGQLPLHSSTALLLGNISTTRYLAIHDAILSPQLLLLRWLSASQFSLVQLLLMYTVGFLGLLALQAKFKLSLFTFSILFALYNFNGHILAHLSVGHLTWTSNFWLSWFVWLVFNLLEGKSGWLWVAQLAGLFFVLLLEGGYHQVVWCLIFMGLLAVFNPSKFWTLTKAAVFTVLLGAARLLPEVSLLSSINTTFLAGYPNVWSLWTEAVTIEQPGVSILIENTVKKIGLWEVTLFVGLVGTLFMLYFGIVHPLLRKRTGASFAYWQILAPIMGIALLSMNQVYRLLLSVLPLPIFSGERVSTRMFFVAFVFIMVLAASEFQAWLNARTERKFSMVLFLILLAMGLNELFQNFLTWRLAKASPAFPVGDFNPENWLVANNFADAPYLNLVMLGLVISALTLVFLVVMIRHERKSVRG